MAVRLFFKRHPRVRELICDHITCTDIGTFTDWNGNKQLVCQCDICGKIGIGERPRWYPLPEEFSAKKEHGAGSDHTGVTCHLKARSAVPVHLVKIA